MNESEITELTDRLGGIFPDWKASDEETQAWRKLFAPLVVEEAKLAMDDFFLTRRFRRPEPAKYLICYQNRRTRGGHDGTDQVERVIDTFIQCVEAPPSYPGRLGRFVPVLGRIDQEWTLDQLRDAAEAMRARYELTYGGRWEIIYNTSFDERAEARLRLMA